MYILMSIIQSCQIESPRKISDLNIIRLTFYQRYILSLLQQAIDVTETIKAVKIPSTFVFSTAPVVKVLSIKGINGTLRQYILSKKKKKKKKKKKNFLKILYKF